MQIDCLLTAAAAAGTNADFIGPPIITVVASAASAVKFGGKLLVLLLLIGRGREKRAAAVERQPQTVFTMPIPPSLHLNGVYDAMKRLPFCGQFRNCSRNGLLHDADAAAAQAKTGYLSHRLAE